MPISTEERLRERGWSEEEIARAISVMSTEKEKKTSLLFSESMKTFVYWFGLIIAIICNFFASAFLVPILLILEETFLYIVISVLGLAFGFMFAILIKDLEGVGNKHHIVGGVLIPAIAVINVYVMVDLSNSFNTILMLRAAEIGDIFVIHNPIIISAVYVVSFVLPYLFYKIRDLGKKKRKHEEGGGVQIQQPQQPQYQQQYPTAPQQNL